MSYFLFTRPFEIVIMIVIEFIFDFRGAVMDYYINPSAFSAVFTVPSAIADKHLKLAKGDHIKVILFMFKNMSEELSVEDIVSGTGVGEYDVKEALLYWADTGILLPKSGDIQSAVTDNAKTVTAKSEKPTRSDIAKRGNEDPKIKYLLQETQIKFGRSLKTNEIRTLVWLYDDEGLDVSLILMIVQFAVSHNRANIRFIESTAVDWINRGVTDVSVADAELNRLAEAGQAWSIVQSAFGIDKRMPSKKEQELAYKWTAEWHISKELLRCAYDACVNAKSKFSMPYVAKIIENWHEKGYKTPKDIESDEKPNLKNEDGYAAYDLDLFEKMLNSKD